jgi:tRNA dimethylallyltransferase
MLTENDWAKMTGHMQSLISQLDPQVPVLIAGPTASGKSELALRIAESQGGVVINADAIQVYDDWRVLTARPSAQDEARAPHALYGHVPGSTAYSVGHWLRDLEPYLEGRDRPIIVGGTGLYLTALTQGLAQIPAVNQDIRDLAEEIWHSRGLEALIADLDDDTRARIDLQNPARITRAWEVWKATGKQMAQWQDETPPARLPLAQTQPFVFDAPKDWLTPRIERRFDQMIEQGALDEARANEPDWSPDLPSAKAIGARELIAHLRGQMTLKQACAQSTILTRQFAKRQRTWFRARMKEWHHINGAQPE